MRIVIIRITQCEDDSDVNAKPVSCNPAPAASIDFSSAPRAEMWQRCVPPDSVPATLLFGGRHEVLIGHNGDTYRLRITRNGKLILTK